MKEEKKFGFVFVAFFLVLGIWPALKQHHFNSVRLPLLLSSVLIFGLTLFSPDVLYWPNRIWTVLAKVLQKIVHPVVMTVLFFGLFTPVAMISRFFRKRILAKDSSLQTSYWVIRKKPDFTAEDMKHQF